MELKWFKKGGIVYIPVSVAGWIIALAGFIYAVYSFIDIDSRSHSVSDTLMNFVFRLLIIFAVYTLIAYMTSKSPKK
jgi:hypothetical protein